MKKTIAFLLAVILCLSLGGAAFAAGGVIKEEGPEEAAGGESVELTAENWEEYFILAPEYEGKVTGYEIADIQGSVTFKPVPKVDDAVEVPITLENWANFFEVTEERQEQKDAFGGVESASIRYSINVRDAYADHVVPGMDSTVAFQVTASHVFIVPADDYSDRFPSDSTAAYDPDRLEEEPWSNQFDQLYGFEQYGPDGDLEQQEYEENITVTRVAGSLFLAGVDEEELEEAIHPPKQYDELGVGSSGESVQALQQALIDQGFLDGAADGEYGDGTAAGVQAFQESAGLEATGTADSETQRALFGD